MSGKIKIAIDAMGGENAPDKIIDGISKFVENNKSEITFKLELDSSLGRGDFTIDMGGVVQSIKYKKLIE